MAGRVADIIAIDICRDYEDVGYPLASEADLAETVKAVEALDRRIVASVADVRDAGALRTAGQHGAPDRGGHPDGQRPGRPGAADRPRSQPRSDLYEHAAG
ncbi:MAG: hypothetical protein WAK82_42730 [Streptosporangiaceae bacterium]